MDKKIIFFDIDGTLIDMNRKKITERMMETLHRLQDNGIKICLATGRAPVTLPVFEGLTFDAYVTFNGSFCYVGDEIICSNALTPEDVKAVMTNATAMGRPVSVATGTRLACNGADADLIEYYSFSGLTPEITEDFESVFDEEIYQIMLGCERSQREQLLVGTANARITAWWERAVDIIPMAGGKGKGIDQVLAYFGLTREEAAAFGDGGNDMEMLQTVGLGVAMANATDELKAVADDFCGHVAEDGIYHYCLEKGWI